MIAVERADPGTRARLGMWTFLASESLFFGAACLGFLVYRRAYRDGFAIGSGQLDLLLGGANTLVMLTSSLCMALAVALAQAGRRRPARRLLCVTAGLGLVFLAVKAVEYRNEIGHGLAPWLPGLAGGRPAVELFFGFYFILTGLHAVHLLGGLGAILTLAARPRDPHLARRIQAAGLFWHFVDIVWVFLFPLLYLIR